MLPNMYMVYGISLVCFWDEIKWNETKNIDLMWDSETVNENVTSNFHIVIRVYSIYTIYSIYTRKS